MGSYIFLAVGLLVGAALGWFASRAKQPKAVADDLSQELAIKNAAAEATISGLATQLAELTRERNERDERDREENKLLQALAPVKLHLEQMQSTVAKLEEERPHKEV